MSSNAGKKRVLFVDHTASLGGGEIALLNLVSNLDQTRYEPSVLLFSNGPLAQRLTDARVETYVIPLSATVANAKKDSLGPGTLMRLPQVFRSITFTWRVARFIKTNRIDLVHTNSLKADLLGGLAAKMSRKPLVWHIRDRIDKDYLPQAVAQAFRWLCRYVPDFVIANSAATLETVRLGRAERSTAIASGIELRSRVVHDGMDRTSEDQPGDDPDQRPRIVGLVGRITRWKGQHIFLEAAAHVRQRFPRVRFQIIGGPLFDERDYEEELHAITRRLKLTDCVEFTGFREDVPKLLSRLEILVHASITAEPFGQVVTEGMLAAKPVVATAGGGVLEIVMDGVTGLLVPMGNAEAMADAICQLLANPDAARRMGKVGRERVLQNFTIEQTVAKIECVYDEMFAVPQMMSFRMPRIGTFREIIATGTSLGLVSGAFMITNLLRGHLGDNAPVSSLFLLAVAVSTRWFGVGAGLLTTIASTLAVAYLLPPDNSWIVDRLHLPVLILFATVALIITPLIGSLRKAEARARAAQVAAENARADAEFIVRAAAAFAICTNVQSIVQAITHLANSVLSDWCVVDVVQGDGTLSRAGAAHRDAGKYELARKLCALGPPSYADDPVVRTIRTRRLSRFDPIDKRTTVDRQDRQRILLYSQLGTQHGIAIPLNSGGRTVAVISLFRADPNRPYHCADVNLAGELASRAAIVLAGLGPESFIGVNAMTLEDGLRAAVGPMADGAVTANA